MSAISLKSITGITSITTPAGVDNQLTLHNNNTTEAVKLDIAGNLHFHNHLNITGVSTASNFKTGTSNLHNTGLNVQDLDVDGHTNLDNVSIAGVTTTSGNIIIENAEPSLFLTDTNANPDYKIFNDQGVFKIYDTTYSATRFQVATNGQVTVQGNANFPNGITMNPGTASVVNTIAQRLGNTTAKIRFPANDTFTVETAGDERFRITSAGKIGIGTDDPKQKVSINNGRVSIDIRGDYYGAWIDGDTQGTSSFNVGRWHNAGGRMRSGGSNDNDLVVETQNTSHNLQLQPSGGSVNIGMSGESTRLAVKGISGALSVDSRANISLFTGATDGASATGTGILFFNHSGSGQFFGGSLQVIKENSGNGNTDSLMRFATRANGGAVTERMRITSGGTLGINLLSPDTSFRLDCSGAAQFTTSTTNQQNDFLAGQLTVRNNQSAQGAFIDFRADSNNGTQGVIAKIGGFNTYNGSGYDGLLTFSTRQNSNNTMVERLRIKNDGTSQFTGNEVKLYNSTDNSNTYFYTENTGAGNAGIRMKNGSGEWTIIANDSLRFRDEDGNADRLNITSNGNILVNGTTFYGTGSGTLQVHDSTLVLSKVGSGTRNWRFVNNNLVAGNLGLQVSNADNGSTTYVDRIEIDKDGKVCIGNPATDPIANLEVHAANPILYVRDSAGTSVDNDAKIGFGNASHYPVAYLSHIWDGTSGSLTAHTRSGGNENLALQIDAAARLRTRGASNVGHGGMVYIQGYSDPVADETHSNLSVRGEGGNGFACGTYEATGNYASWIQAGYLPNFTGGSPAAIYPLVLQPNGAPVCIGNKNDASTTDAGLLRVQTVTGGSYTYQKYGLSLEHFNSSDVREQKFLFINENSQGTQAEANSIFRQHATPYNTSTTYQVWTDRIVYQHRPLYNQYSWYKFNVHVTSSSRGGSARIGITWSSRHAGPGGYGEYSFAWTDEHHTSRAQVFLRKQHFLTSGGASHGPYNWTSSPAVTVYSSTGGGSQGGFYLRVEGHLDANSSTYDGGVMHHFDIVHNDNNTGGNNTYFEFVQYGSSGPSQANQVLSFN